MSSFISVTKKREIKSCVRPDDINDNFFNDLLHFPMEYSVSAWLDGGDNEIRVRDILMLYQKASEPDLSSKLSG